MTDSSEGAEVAVLIPSYGRADRLAAVAANIHDATEVERRRKRFVERCAADVAECDRLEAAVVAARGAS